MQTSIDRGQPLYDLLRYMRQPVSLRDIMASGLRHLYIKDPFKCESPKLGAIPPELLQIEVKDEPIAGTRCLTYRPPGIAPTELRPTFIYLHGGGYVAGTVEDVDYVARKLCFDNRAIVISVDYPLAPESPFPKGLDACAEVVRWAEIEGASVGVDAKKLILAGDSAGGGLAAALWQRAITFGVMPKALVLLGPWLSMDVEQFASYNQFAPEGIVFDAAFIGYCRSAYARYEQWLDPLVSPLSLGKSELGSLPPTLIVTGTVDPLTDQAEAFAKKAGDKVQLATFDGMPHCFYVFPGLFPEESTCFARIREFLA